MVYFCVMKYLMSMKTLSQESYSSIADWIEKIIDSCDATVREQEKICDQLITNFTKQILFFHQDFGTYVRLETKLRRKLLSKFYN